MCYNVEQREQNVTKAVERSSTWDTVGGDVPHGI